MDSNDRVLFRMHLTGGKVADGVMDGSVGCQLL